MVLRTLCAIRCPQNVQPCVPVMLSQQYHQVYGTFVSRRMYNINYSTAIMPSTLHCNVCWRLTLSTMYDLWNFAGKYVIIYIYSNTPDLQYCDTFWTLTKHINSNNKLWAYKQYLLVVMNLLCWMHHLLKKTKTKFNQCWLIGRKKEK